MEQRESLGAGTAEGGQDETEFDDMDKDRARTLIEVAEEKREVHRNKVQMEEDQNK